MGATCVSFGKYYGHSKFHTRLDTLHGEQPVIFCRQNQIWYVGSFGCSTCEECGGASESLFHLFWECTKVKETWSFSSLFPLLSMTHFRSFFEFLWHILMGAQWGMEDSGLAMTII